MTDQRLTDWISDFIAGAEHVIEEEKAALTAVHHAEAVMWMRRVDRYCSDCPKKGGCQPVIVAAAFEAVGRH